MTPRTAATATSVVAPERSISHRTLATMRAAAGSRGFSSSASGSLMVNRSRREKLVVAGADSGGRLDRVLASRMTNLSRSRLKALILAGEVAIGARTIRDPGHRVNAGDALTVNVPAPQAAIPAGEAISL